jgi:large subunit ribosomal protein L13
MTHLTHSTNPISSKEISRSWHLIDVKGKILGRVADQISVILQGKKKVNYAPYLDNGDSVVVINARHIKISGSKAEDKLYTYYSGYPGGLKSLTFKDMILKNPTEVIRHAVSGMLPKNKLRDRRLARFYIFPDERHTHGDKFATKATETEKK